MAAVAKSPDDGALMLRICMAVSAADGDITLADQIEIVSLCSRLGIDPKDCDLYVNSDPKDLISDD